MMKTFFKYFSFLALFFVVLFISLQLNTVVFFSQKTDKTNSKNFTQPDTTEVFVVGTLHKPTNKVSYDDLYNLLETIKPNVILFEVDSSHFDSKMNFKNKWRSLKMFPFLEQYLQGNLERIAAQKYLYYNKFAIVRPYEWSLRDKFHKENHILTMPIKVFQKLDELNTTNKLTASQKAVLENRYNLSNQLATFADSTLYEINTVFQDSIASQRQYVEYHELKAIADSNENLKEFREFCKINEDYWHIRNKAMATNIEVYIKLFPKSRIVVLNGYYHRYYLRKELMAKQQELNFKLMDIPK